MLILRKILITLKHYWYIPVLIAVGIGLVLLLQKGQAAKVFKIAMDSIRKQKEAVTLLETQEKEKLKEVEEKYEVILNNLDEKYKEDVEGLSNWQKEHVDELLEKHKDNPKKLTELLSDLYGLDNLDEGE